MTQHDRYPLDRDRFLRGTLRELTIHLQQPGSQLRHGEPVPEYFSA